MPCAWMPTWWAKPFITVPVPALCRLPARVVADIIDISRLITADTGNRVPHLAFQPSQVKPREYAAYG